MSDYSSDSGNSRNSGGSDRSDSGRRRSNNRGGRRDGNRGGRRDGRRDGNRDGNRDGGRDGNRNRQSGRDSNAAPRRTPTPQPLTFWQKILKAIGLYDPTKPTKRTTTSRVPKPEPRPDASGGNREPRGKREPRGERKPRPDTRGNSKPVETTRLYVGNLSYDATEHDLEDLFKGAGTVDNVEIVYNRNTHRSKGYAFIEMGSIAEAKRAVETLHDQTFMERQLIVSGAKSKGPADGRDEDREDREYDAEDRENRAASGSGSEEAA